MPSGIKLRYFLRRISTFRSFVGLFVTEFFAVPEKPLGLLGESIAEKYLQTNGYSIICRNWRCRYGELDIVCSKNGQIVFVEVKTRLESQLATRHLLDNITYQKQRKLRILSALFFSRYVRSYSFNLVPRIDILGVLVARDRRRATVVEHLKGAVGVE